MLDRAIGEGFLNSLGHVSGHSKKFAHGTCRDKTFVAYVTDRLSSADLLLSTSNFHVLCDISSLPNVNDLETKRNMTHIGF